MSLNLYLVYPKDYQSEERPQPYQTPTEVTKRLITNPAGTDYDIFLGYTEWLFSSRELTPFTFDPTEFLACLRLDPAKQLVNTEELYRIQSTITHIEDIQLAVLNGATWSWH